MLALQCQPAYLSKLLISLFDAVTKQEFNYSCSIQIYSVQASIPKDTAVLWNPEFVQAEELFNQPFDEDNCLRDNRYSTFSPFHFLPSSQS
jgi:DNA polymerase delta subunit 3